MRSLSRRAAPKTFSKWVSNNLSNRLLALLPPYSKNEEKWRKHGSKQTTLILMKNSHFYRTLRYVCSTTVQIFFGHSTDFAHFNRHHQNVLQLMCTEYSL